MRFVWLEYFASARQRSLHLGGFLLLIAASQGAAQNADSSKTDFTALLGEYRSLAQELSLPLITVETASSKPPSAEVQKKTSRLQALQNQIAEIAANAPVPILPEMKEVEIPEDASPALESLLVQRAELHNSQVRSQNANRSSTPALRQKASEKWSQENQIALQTIASLAQTVTDTTPAQPIPPGRVFIPKNATPALAALLTEREAMQNERNQIWNSYLASSPAERERALRVWEQLQTVRLGRIAEQARQVTAESEKNLFP